MQNIRFLEASIRALRERHPRTEILRGDRYHPVLAVQVLDLPLPATILERTATVIIPLPRCAGFLPDASINGVFIPGGAHGEHAGSPTLIPFCDPVDLPWVAQTARFYPLLDVRPEVVAPTHFVCLDSETHPAMTPLAVLAHLEHYLRTWRERAFEVARRHGAILRGRAPGDLENSGKWIEHLLEHVSPALREALVSATRGEDDPGGRRAAVSPLEPSREP